MSTSLAELERLADALESDGAGAVEGSLPAVGGKDSKGAAREKPTKSRFWRFRIDGDTYIFWCRAY